MFTFRPIHRIAAVLGLSAALGAFTFPAVAGQHYHSDFEEPPVFTSAHGKLNLMIVAKAVPNPFVADLAKTTAWVYETCQKDPASPAWNVKSCDGVPGTSARNGGPVLHLKPGDVFKVRFVNQLPMAPDFARAADDKLLNYNPTNLHAHGMLIEPRTPTAKRNTYGDTIYVLAFPSANVASNKGAYFNNVNPLPQPPKNITVPILPSQGPHQHADILPDMIDYEFDVPANHPSGIFILHPHPHGPTSNQMQAGLSSMIEVGSYKDRICADWLCLLKTPVFPVRHLALNDTQTGADGRLLTEIDAAFCKASGQAANNNGYCAGDKDKAGKSKGKWFFSVSGQIYPKINVSSAEGEIWNIANQSPNATYTISLTDNATGKAMPMQLISVDGVSINTISQDTQTNDMVRLGAAKFRMVNCPRGKRIYRRPVCADSITMMSSSRVELWITHRETATGNVTPAAGAGATLKTAFWNSGFDPYGDPWPAINLADVTFNQPRAIRPLIHVKSNRLYGAGGILSTAAPPQYQVPAFKDASGKNLCAPLARNQYRRIYYGPPKKPDGTTDPQGLGLGWEVMQLDPITRESSPVPGTLHDVQAFDLNTTEPLCVQLGRNNHPVAEVWEVVNLSPEAHNFHIHQSKFRVVDITQRNPLSPYYTRALDNRDEFGQFQTTSMDNVALPPASGSNTPANLKQGGCTIAQYHAGKCQAAPIQLELPFKFAGDFVYHCHILSHEDAGMMNKIRVATYP
jgi:L-ascorbate oxidase